MTRGSCCRQVVGGGRAVKLRDLWLRFFGLAIFLALSIWCGR